MTEMLYIEQSTRLLSHCLQSPLSVSQLAGRMRQNHEKTVELVKELERRRLLVRNVEKPNRGRPRHMLRTTLLGERFLEQYRELLNVRLYSNANDIKKAIHQANLTQRLLEQQVPLYVRFQELNDLARNIAGSAQASRNP